MSDDVDENGRARSEPPKVVAETCRAQPQNVKGLGHHDDLVTALPTSFVDSHTCSERLLAFSVSVLREHARRPEIVTSMREFYAEVDREITAHDPTCWNKGECCRFGQFGHRLYVTSLELAHYLATGDLPPPVTSDACPHSFGGRCHARERRPLGCRVFYCDPNTQHWQGPLSERRLTQLKAMHEALRVPYMYVDWMTAVKAMRYG
ncbi:MAG: hypothetical protein ACUVXJ_17885 [Phycisphaerae bacterium]